MARGNVIVSPGRENTETEVDLFVQTFAEAVQKLREMDPLT